MNPTLKRANKELEAEMKKQVRRIFPAAVVIFWGYGWRKLRIFRRLITVSEVWQECASYATEKSMMQMLEDETGIEIRLQGYDKSFHELTYLDAKVWDGHEPTIPELIYIRHQQKKWMAPQILSAICISLYRDEHMSIPKIAQFICEVDQYLLDHGDNPKEYAKQLTKKTEITIEELLKVIE